MNRDSSTTDAATAHTLPAGESPTLADAGKPGQCAARQTWLWTGTLVLLASCVVYGYHQFAVATYFQTDDYVWRLWAVIEPRPWRAFIDDLGGGKAYRPLRFLCWYGLERLNRWLPGVHPWALLAWFTFYGWCVGLLAAQLSGDRWVGLVSGMLSLLCPILGQHALMWYSVLEDPAALIVLATWCTARGRQTGRKRWVIAAVLAAATAALFKENAFVLPALVCLVLLTGRSDGGASHSGRPSFFQSVWTKLVSLCKAWIWWAPLVVVMAGIAVCRSLVIGGSGMIGHHGLIGSDFGAVVPLWVNLLGLIGADPVGSFYLPAVARSFPISFVPGPTAWGVQAQLTCLAVLPVAWSAVWWWSRDSCAWLAAAGWYVISWLPALALTVVQPSYLFLPNFAVFLALGLLLRRLTRHPAVLSPVVIALACGLSWHTARHYREATSGADAVRRETDGLVEMVRRESERLPTGTRVFLIGSKVLRPDLIAEFDAACQGRRCPLDLYNFVVPLEIIVPAQSPLTLPAALRIETEGIREGRIRFVDRELYFVSRASGALTDPGQGNRFWMPVATGWSDVTEAVNRGRVRF